MISHPRGWLAVALGITLTVGCATPDLKKLVPFGKTALREGERPPTAKFSMEYAKGRNFEGSGELDKARDIYTQLRRAYPRRPEVLHRMGVVADKQRRHGEAQKLYTDAIRMKPNNAEFFNDLGYCFYLQGKLTKAERAMRKAVTLNPESPRFHINLGMTIGHQGRLDEAFAEFSKVGSAADAYYNLASVHAFKGDFEQAKVCFRKALATDPMHQLAQQSLANFEKFEASDSGGDEVQFASSDTRYVPYLEDGQVMNVGSEPTASGQGTVQQTAHQQGIVTSHQAPSATRALHRQSRGMLNRNMASQRNESPLR